MVGTQADNKLLPSNLTVSSREIVFDDKSGGVMSGDIPSGQLLVSPRLDVPSTATDFVDAAIVVRHMATSNQPELQPSIGLWWCTDSDGTFSVKRHLSLPACSLASPLHGTGQPVGSVHYRFNVSQYKSWIMSKNITQIALDINPAPYTMHVGSVRLLGGTRDIPVLEPDSKNHNSSGRTMAEDPAGVSRPGRTFGYFRYDAHSIVGADRVVCEISRPDSWFEHYTGELHDRSCSKEALFIKELPRLQGNAGCIDAKSVTRPGYYELRVFALDSDGRVAGYSSDPLNIQLSSEDFARKPTSP